MKTIFTLLFSFFTISAFCQQNFVPGYYITQQGDKVEVQINDQNWDRNPTFIEVKGNTENATVNRLGVSDIRGFALSSGDVFETFVVDVDKSPTKMNDIVPNSQPLIVRETVFLRVIVKGAVSLYHLKDEAAKEHYFISKGEEMPIELIYRASKFTDGDKIGYTKLPLYKGMLRASLTDCPAVTEKVDKLNFNHKSLKGFIADYNKCVSGSEGTYQAPKEKLQWNFGVLGGASSLNMKISSDDNEAISEPSYSNTSYTAGVAVITTLPRVRSKWSLKNEFMLKPVQFEGTYEEGRNVGQENYRKVDTSFDMTYVGLNTLVQYKILDSGIKPYVAAGFANNFMVTENNSQTVFRRYYSIESTKEQKPFESIRKHEQALLVGAGVSLGKLAAELRFEAGNGFSPATTIRTARKTATLQVSYTLK